MNKDKDTSKFDKRATIVIHVVTWSIVLMLVMSAGCKKPSASVNDTSYLMPSAGVATILDR